MSLATDLRTYLLAQASISDLVSARIYPLKRPQRSAVPAIVYEITAAPGDSILTGPSGWGSCSVRFVCWHPDYLSARALAAALRALLQGAGPLTMGASKVHHIECEGEDDDLEPPANASDEEEIGISVRYTLYYDTNSTAL